MKTPSQRIIERFAPKMEARGFRYYKASNNFKRTFALGAYEYKLLFDGRGGLVSVEPGIFVHFSVLNKLSKKLLNWEVFSEAGATLLNAGIEPYKVWLFDTRFSGMKIQERAHHSTVETHPDSRIDAGVQFLENTFQQHANPLFEKLSTYQDLLDFYLEYIHANGNKSWRPHTESVIYLSLILSIILNANTDVIMHFAGKTENEYRQFSKSAGDCSPINIMKNLAKIQSKAAQIRG